MCDYVMFMKKGNMIIQNNVENIKSEYRSAAFKLIAVLGVLILLLLLSFYTSFVLQLHFDKALGQIMTYVPFLSIFNNIVYTSMADPDWMKVLYIIFVQLIYTTVAGYICSRLFRKRITKYGKEEGQKEAKCIQ